MATVRRVLKKSTIRTGEVRKLDPPNIGGSSLASNAQASVVGQEGNAILIKVVCGCGEEILLRCATAPAVAAGASGGTANV